LKEMIKKILKAIWTERKKMIEQPGKKKCFFFQVHQMLNLRKK
jgi:hypothetical protein